LHDILLATCARAVRLAFPRYAPASCRAAHGAAIVSAIRLPSQRTSPHLHLGGLKAA
jgi:hypothetical protein